MEERLNKLLSAMGVCSRREADRLIESGTVSYTHLGDVILALSKPITASLLAICVAVLLYPAVKKMLSSRSAGNGRAGKSENQSK